MLATSAGPCDIGMAWVRLEQARSPSRTILTIMWNYQYYPRVEDRSSRKKKGVKTRLPENIYVEEGLHWKGRANIHDIGSQGQT
jgi:hypothetical protein